MKRELKKQSIYGPMGHAQKVFYGYDVMTLGLILEGAQSASNLTVLFSSTQFYLAVYHMTVYMVHLQLF